MNTEKKTIICDLDDVLWDMVPTWCHTYNRLPGIRRIFTPTDFTTWDISQIVGEEASVKFYDFLKQDSFWDEVVENQDKAFIMNTKIYLEMLMKKYNVYITTATDYSNKHKLDLFFSLYDCIPKNHLILIWDKWLLDSDIIIDDKAETLYEFDKKRKRCVKINRPWNYWFNCEGYNTFIDAAKVLISEAGE